MTPCGGRAYHPPRKPKAVTMEQVRVSTAVRAIEGWFVFDGRRFRGVVCATLLETTFEARASPQGWIAAYRANADAIDAALAAKATVANGVQVAVLTESDLALFTLPGEDRSGRGDRMSAAQPSARQAQPVSQRRR